MIVNNCIQGSDAWIQARLGIPTSSKFSKIVTPKGAFSTQSIGYQDELLAEYISNKPQSNYMSNDMEVGVEREQQARFFYEMIKDVTVEEVGLVYLNEDKKISCSPDGIIGDRGLEIKCPKLTTQIKRVREGVLPSEYYAQVQGSMWITGFKEWDFLSYNPKYMPLLITVKRDEDYIKKLSEAVIQFSKELEALKTELEEWKNKI